MTLEVTLLTVQSPPKTKVSRLRAELAAYEAQRDAMAGHAHLERALELAEEILQGQVTAGDKDACLNMVRLHAERLKRDSENVVKNYLAAPRESLTLTFANMALFAAYDVGLSDEFFTALSHAELATLFRKPFSKWGKKDYEQLYRLLPSWKPK